MGVGDLVDLKIQYEDLLSGDPISVKGVGHIRSPKLKEMSPSSGIGWDGYSIYIYFLKAGCEQLKKDILKNDAIDGSIYEIVTQNCDLRTLYEKAFSFFMLETVAYEETNNVFVSIASVPDEESDDGVKNIPIGLISESNFDDVRAMILTMNYITLSQTDVKTTHSSEASKAAWDEVQNYLNKQVESTPKDDGPMTLGNMMSKLCAIHPSINYTNIFDLTVFQFYDTFFQTCYMRSISFSEAVVSNHGSKDFKYEDWLNPIKNS